MVLVDNLCQGPGGFNVLNPSSTKTDKNPLIATLAKHYSKVIIKEQLRCAGNNKTVYNPAPLYEKVDIHSVSTTDVKTMGAEHLAVNSLQEYGFDKILKDLKFSDKEIDYAKMLIVARLVHPASERETARGIFDLKETVILYDLTNTYFEGSKRTSRLSKPGKSKERRNDRPLVTLALTVDEDGFPKQSK